MGKPGPRRTWDAHPHPRRASRLTLAGPPGVLLAYRLACFAWGLALGINQLLREGLWLLHFATIWNWLLLTAFFGSASAASIKAALRRGCMTVHKAEEGSGGAMPWLGRAPRLEAATKAPAPPVQVRTVGLLGGVAYAWQGCHGSNAAKATSKRRCLS